MSFGYAAKAWRELFGEVIYVSFELKFSVNSEVLLLQMSVAPWSYLAPYTSSPQLRCGSPILCQDRTLSLGDPFLTGPFGLQSPYDSFQIPTHIECVELLTLYPFIADFASPRLIGSNFFGSSPIAHRSMWGQRIGNYWVPLGVCSTPTLLLALSQTSVQLLLLVISPSFLENWPFPSQALPTLFSSIDG